LRGSGQAQEGRGSELAQERKTVALWPQRHGSRDCLGVRSCGMKRKTTKRKKTEAEGLARTPLTPTKPRQHPRPTIPAPPFRSPRNTPVAKETLALTEPGVLDVPKKIHPSPIPWMNKFNRQTRKRKA
jgi:hypothetical protein